MATIVVTASRAIYVDDHRITDRSTKPWGGSSTVYEAHNVPRSSVVEHLVAAGYGDFCRRIDEDEFVRQRELINGTA